MDASVLRIVADDLTGACDVAAALLPWEVEVAVAVYPSPAPDTLPRLWVRNTQSRTLGVDRARAAVGDALQTAPPGPDGVVVKKIDTALRGHLGAELDAAMHATGAEEGFVLAAIPEIGRTTVGGVQYIDGVPVHRTAFANDPLHPIEDSRIAAHVERDSERRCRALSLAEVRSRPALAAAIERGRRAGYSVFVCDAEQDDDLDRALDVVLERARPMVLAGSLGLGKAVRRRIESPSARAPARAMRPAAGGTLVVVGSTHPMARTQARMAVDAALHHEVADGASAARVATRAADALGGGENVLVCTPAGVRADADASLHEALVRAVVACVGACRPGAFVLVGGETAHGVLTALRQPWIRIVEGLAPLIVGGAMLGGALGGTPLVTKGGSAGDPMSLRRAIEWSAGDGR